MDRPTYERFEDFGTNVDERGVLLRPRKRQVIPHLSAPEREMYLIVTDPNWTRHRPLEQERIPLVTGVEQVLAAVTDLPVARPVSASPPTLVPRRPRQGPVTTTSLPTRTAGTSLAREALGSPATGVSHVHLPPR